MCPPTHNPDDWDFTGSWARHDSVDTVSVTDQDRRFDGEDGSFHPALQARPANRALIASGLCLMQHNRPIAGPVRSRAHLSRLVCQSTM
jgi:hypothetical protein